MKDHKCTQCDKSFKEKRGLQEHLYKIHNGAGKAECPICQRKIWKSYIDLHIHFVHQGKCVKCSQCDKFIAEGAIANHLRVCQVAERAFKFDLCSLAFRTTGSMRQHKILAHTGGGNVKCPICLKKLCAAVTAPQCWPVLCHQIFHFQSLK